MADKPALSGVLLPVDATLPGEAPRRGQLAAPWSVDTTATNDSVAVGEALWVDASGAGTAGLSIALPSSPTAGQRVLVGKLDNVARNPVYLVGKINRDVDGGRISTPGTSVTLQYVDTALGWAVEAVSNGAATVTDLPSVEAVLTAAYTGLGAGDYLMAGNMTVGPDPFGMWVGGAGFYRVLIGATGRYDIEWAPHLLLSSGVAAAKVLRNVPAGTSSTTAVQSYSILSDVVSNPGAEGAPVAIRRTRALNAGDTLSFSVYGSATFDMPVTRFGGLETRLTVRYVGKA